MRFGILAVAVAAVFLAATGSVRAGDGVLVWRLQAKTGVSETDIDSLSGYLAAEVERHSGLRITSQADIETILEGEAQKMRCGAGGSDACLAEIGGALGVPEAVSGDLGHVGEVWILNLRRVDVRNAAPVRRVSRQTKGAITSMVEELPYVVAELYGRELARPVAVIPAVVAESSGGMGAWRIAGWSALSAGAGLLLLGGVSHWQMTNAWDDARHGDLAAADRHATWKGAAIAGYAVGGAGLLAGAVILLLDPDGETVPDASVAVGPWDGGIAIMAGGRF